MSGAFIAFEAPPLIYYNNKMIKLYFVISFVGLFSLYSLYGHIIQLSFFDVDEKFS